VTFETDYKKIIEQIDRIDPVQYGKTRNYVDGAVTRLSPYISRGVISTKLVLERMLEKGYPIAQMEQFVKELCWRDYFQRIAQVKNINEEISQPQSPVEHHQMPEAVVKAATGIERIDDAINLLYEDGYVHNHCRMYIASLVCNIAKAHWKHPAQWMYYHLLDGDWASNVCSWQWVAGTKGKKKYYCNQQNINQYTRHEQGGTFLDQPYELLPTMETPAELKKTQVVRLETVLPETKGLEIQSHRPTFVYNYYNLDPLWHSNKPGNRILLLEPDVFAQYPVSNNCIEFALALGKNIPDLQVYTGSFESLRATCNTSIIYYKEHPFNKYTGIEEERDWIVKEVTGYEPSFFSYWKKTEPHLLKKQKT
jgi:deoxyribodipyrimidine photo-lyase